MKKIDKFQGETRWLSNFATGRVKVFGYDFRCREGAFQAMKDPRPEKVQKFLEANGSESKALGRIARLRPDWESVKDEVMYEVCKAYYLQNPESKDKLLATDGIYLEEGNTWGDRYWGVCNGTGKNKLGHILMKVRNELLGRPEVDCNFCIHLNITEEEQKGAQTNIPHICMYYDMQVYHHANTQPHNAYLHPCRHCSDIAYPNYEVNDKLFLDK